MNKNLKLDIEIGKLITQAEKKEITFKEFDIKLKQLEILKECTITI